MKNRLYLFAAAFIVLIGLIWLLAPILLPFAAGIVLAYLVDPLVRRLRKTGMPRWGGALLVVSALVVALLGTIAVAVPYIAKLVSEAVKAVPQKIQNLLQTIDLQPMLAQVQEHIDVQTLLEQLAKSSEKVLAFMLNIVKSTGLETLALFDLFSLLLITPMVMFYILRDWPQFIGSCKKLLPRDLLKPAENLLLKIDAALAGFLRGQTAVCLLLGIFYAVGLSLVVSLKGGVLIGLLTGAFSFVPIIGMTLGVLIAAATALLQFQLESGITPYLLMAAVFIAGQVLEGFVLTPRLVGNRVNLHPAWVVFAILAGGQLGGMLGVIVALPVAAILNVLIREAAAYWKRSVAYSGSNKKPAAKSKKRKK